MRPRYRFGDFTVSPARRIVLRAGREVPLIPRYFDLLVLLVAERHRAVQRSEILDAVWSDVVVSDGALSQAVRTLRRALGDTAREPLFIRTVSRHGYRFVHAGVIEESDDSRDLLSAAPAHPSPAEMPSLPPVEAPPVPFAAASDPHSDENPFEPLLSRLLDGRPEGTRADDEARMEAAESLHLLGTRRALQRLDRRPGHERGRAFLRQARWEVPGAGPVPILGQPGWIRTAFHVVALRLRCAARVASRRWGGAAAGGAVAGALGGFLGGLVLRPGAGGQVSMDLPAALSVLGLVAGGAGAAGVGAGLAFAEAVARSMRGAALVLCGAAAGGATGWAAHRLVRGTLEGLFGRDLPSIGGGVEGLVIGAAAGLGYALATPRPHGGGMATPRGLARIAAAAVAGAVCAIAGAGVCHLGGHLAGTSLNLLAGAYEGSQVGLAPFARLLGEAGAGPLTRSVSGGIEGFFFGAGLVAGLTRRPR